jgi:predicted lipid-binding transport protein (Tim44 family)
MYPSTPIPADTTASIGGLLGAVVAGSLLYILFTLGIAVLAVYINYRIMKAAVRNGVVEAIRKTGVGSTGTSGQIQGYPPASGYIGAPAAPASEYPGYRGCGA